jgi:hypothetical protein
MKMMRVTSRTSTSAVMFMLCSARSRPAAAIFSGKRYRSVHQDRPSAASAGERRSSAHLRSRDGREVRDELVGLAGELPIRAPMKVAEEGGMHGEQAVAIRPRDPRPTAVAPSRLAAMVWKAPRMPQTVETGRGRRR